MEWLQPPLFTLEMTMIKQPTKYLMVCLYGIVVDLVVLDVSAPMAELVAMVLMVGMVGMVVVVAVAEVGPAVAAVWAN